jgi:serine/threonine protein kinase
LRATHRVRLCDFRVARDARSTSPSGAEVRECRHPDSSHRLWLKEWSPTGPLSREQFHREAAIYSRVWHPAIIRFEGHIDEGGRLGIITDRLPESLATDKPDDPAQLAIITYGVALAMCELHEYNIDVRVLSEENVRLTGDWEPKLWDFAFGKRRYDQAQTSDTEAVQKVVTRSDWQLYADLVTRMWPDMPGAWRRLADDCRDGKKPWRKIVESIEEIMSKERGAEAFQRYKEKIKTELEDMSVVAPRS